MNLKDRPYLLIRKTRVLSLGLAALMAMAVPCQAQLVPVASAASAAASAPSEGMERAQRQANNVLRWIKIQSDKPRATTAKPAEAPVVAPAVAPLAAASPPPAEVPRPLPRPASVRTPTPAEVMPAKAPSNTASNGASAGTPAPTLNTRGSRAASTAPTLNPSATPPETALTLAQDTPLATAPQSAPAELTPAPQPQAVEPPAEPELEPLVAISQSQPELSKRILESVVDGRVSVRFTVLPNGTVTQAEIVKSSDRMLNRPTLQAVSTWRFAPIKEKRSVTVELAFQDL